MKIQTINPVTFNSGITGSVTENVSGEIRAAIYTNGFKSLQVNYSYYRQNGETIKSDVFTVDGVVALNAQFDLVKNILPPADNEYPYTPTKFYEVFKYHMAATFNTTINNIEIIGE